MTPIPESLEHTITDIQINLATLTTDIKWLKKLFVIVVVIAGGVIGIDLTEMVI